MNTETIGQKNIIALVMSEIMLGRIKLGDSEPDYIDELRGLARQLKRRLKTDELELLSDESLEPVHAIVDGVLDAMFEMPNNPETKARLVKLGNDKRLLAEVLIQKMTGKIGEEGRWPDGLWRLKKLIDRIETNSISGITKAEMRAGYAPHIHSVVDAIHGNWRQILL